MSFRRETILRALTGAVTITTGITLGHGSRAAEPAPSPRWAVGLEGQRKADLDNGTYRNPIFAGDYPDPSVLKDGDDYYITHSSFDAAPGLLIWHSRDLINWAPIGPALERPIGTVFAVDLVKHQDRYFIYIPFMRAPWSRSLRSFANIYVIHAPSMHGPWSDPIDLGIGGLIDPGHAVGEDGQRYIFLSGVNRVRLSADGLSTNGPVEQVYRGYAYPDAWVTEAFSLEGPKLLAHNGWFYMITAEGGTSGPPTGHMVVVARSRSIHGPWQNCPHNPVVRTRSADEQWWSRGHATIVEGPGAQWYMVYHGYENGYRTLGRQTLLDPIEWTKDGWPRSLGGDLSKPLPKPIPGSIGVHGMTRSDNFAHTAFGSRWTFYNAGPDENRRAQVTGSLLILQGKGTGPHDSAPLTQTVGDRAYEISVVMQLNGGVQGGLLLFFNDRLFLGMGHDGTRMTTYQGGKPGYWQEPAPRTRLVHLRISNDHHIITFFYSSNGTDWTRHALRSEASGYHANTMNDLVSLRPALFASGAGSICFSKFCYRALS